MHERAKKSSGAKPSRFPASGRRWASGASPDWRGTSSAHHRADDRRKSSSSSSLFGKGTGGGRIALEFSAGGVVLDDGKVLVVQVESLEGRRLWTFPKGHVEQGETSRQSALREVREETGYRCEVLSPLSTVRYFFTRNGRLVKKQVRWFLMKSVEKVGSPDAEEILDSDWVPLEEARRRLVYPGDLRLLDEVSKR